MNLATPTLKRPVPLSSTRMAICIRPVAGATLRIGRSLPFSLSVNSAAVRSVIGAPLLSTAET